MDAFYLPDTAGVTYQLGHVKTGIVPQMLDRPGRRMWYFHNAGYFELSGDDFDAIFQLEWPEPPCAAPLRRGDPPRPAAATRLRGVEAARWWSSPESTCSGGPPRTRCPGSATTCPRTYLGSRSTGRTGFHPYAFATCRQCGASAELAAAFVDWLDEHDGGGLGGRGRALPRDLHNCQEPPVRPGPGRTRHRKVDLDAPFERMGQGLAGGDGHPDRYLMAEDPDPSAASAVRPRRWALRMRSG